MIGDNIYSHYHDGDNINLPALLQGEVAASTTGLLSHVYSLLDNPMFSDVEILFEDKDGFVHKKMYGHKLILALRSEHFASYFYKSKEKIHQIKVPSSERWSFYLMLKFLYTDDIQLHTLKEAHDLYALAERYSIKELKDKCLAYLLQEKITLQNVLSKYECAISKNIEKLLNDCRTFVCRETKSVFEHAKFRETSFAVVEDIIKQDQLSVSSEFDVISAVMQWAVAECNRKKVELDNKCLRQCIDPFLKYLRFLSLTHTEFGNFLQLYDIFSGFESNLITQKLLLPNCDVDMPKNFCSLGKKRGRVTTYVEKSIETESIPFSEKYKPCKTSVNTVFQSNVEEEKSDKNNLMTYEIKLLPSSSKEKSLSSNKSTKFYSPPNVMDTSVNNNIPIHQYFTFPLLGNSQGLLYSFPRDISCSAIFRMKRGNIKLNGFELAIESQYSTPEEYLKVCVTLEGFKGFEKPKTEIYRKKVSKNTLTIIFSNPAVLLENFEGELEITVDQLTLNRCNIINNQYHEINNNLNFVCNILIKTNQKFENNGLFFLINRLFYTKV